ncbi:MAG: O-antigen ligase family protein [Candidatus Nomurabacteria bacterium]
MKKISLNDNKDNKFLRWTIYISLAIIPFLAFYVSGFGMNLSWNSMLFPYISGKNFAFRILVEIAAAAWLMLMIINKEYRPKKSFIIWAYSAFIFVLLLADIFSVNPTRAFFSNYERMEGFISHAHLFLYFLILVSMFKTKAAWDKYKSVLFISNIPVLLLAFLQLLGLSSFTPMKYLPTLRDAIHKIFAPTQGGNQLDASLGNSTYLAIYTVFFVFLFLITYLENKFEKAKNSWIYLVMLILNLVVLYYTQTRGAQVGFALGIFVSAIVIYFGGKKFSELKLIRNISLGIVAVLLVSFVGLISFKNANFIQSSPTLNRLAKVSSFANPISLSGKISEIKTVLYNPTSTYQDLLAVSGDSTFTSRLLNIKMALAGAKDRPWLGWGQDNYFYVFAKHNDARMYAQEPWFDRTHNVFMDWLIAGGIIGLIAYLALYFSAIWTMWFSKYSKSHKNTRAEFIEKALLTGLLVAYFVHNIFVFDNLVSYLLFFIVLAYINFSFNKSVSENIVSLDKKDVKNKMIIWGPVIGVALCLALYFLNINYIMANRDIINGLSPQAQAGENPVQALSRSLLSFEAAAQIGGIAKMESREQLAQQSLSLINQINSAGIPQTQEYLPVYQMLANYIDTTKKEYVDVVDIKNPDPRSLSIYSAFLRNIGDDADSLKYGKMAHDYAPEKQTITTEYIQELLSNKDVTAANKIAKEMYESDPSYEESLNVYALTNIYVKDFDTAEKLLKNTDGTIAVDQSVAAAYVAVNAQDRLIGILNSNLKTSPNDINSMVILAKVYENIGNRSQSISILNHIAEIRPDLKSEVDSYIKTLK